MAKIPGIFREISWGHCIDHDNSTEDHDNSTENRVFKEVAKVGQSLE